MINNNFENKRDYSEHEKFYSSLDEKLHHLVIKYVNDKLITDFHKWFKETDGSDNNKKYLILRDRIYKDILELDGYDIGKYLSKDLIIDSVIEKIIFKSRLVLMNEIFKLMPNIFEILDLSDLDPMDIVTRILRFFTFMLNKRLTEKEQNILVKNYKEFQYRVAEPKFHRTIQRIHARMEMEIEGTIYSDTDLKDLIRKITPTSINIELSMDKYQQINKYSDYFMLKHSELIFRLYLLGKVNYSPIMYRNYLQNIFENSDILVEYQQFIINLWAHAQQLKEKLKISSRKSLDSIYKREYLALIKFLCHNSEISMFGSNFSYETDGEIEKAWIVFKKRAYAHRSNLGK